MPEAALGLVPLINGPLKGLSGFVEQCAHVLCFGRFIAAWGNSTVFNPANEENI